MLRKELKKFEINGNNYTFVCGQWENSRGWGHEVTLFIEHLQLSYAKVRYINRTWESYQYQSAMLEAINKKQAETIKNAIEEYKAKNNIKRMSKGHGLEVDKMLDENKDFDGRVFRDLKELYQIVAKS